MVFIFFFSTYITPCGKNLRKSHSYYMYENFDLATHKATNTILLRGGTPREWTAIWAPCVLYTTWRRPSVVSDDVHPKPESYPFILDL